MGTGPGASAARGLRQDCGFAAEGVGQDQGEEEEADTGRAGAGLQETQVRGTSPKMDRPERTEVNRAARLQRRERPERRSRQRPATLETRGSRV